MEVASLNMSFNAGEHKYRKITVTLEKALNAKSVRLAFVTPKGKRLMSDPLDTDGVSAEYPLPAEVLDGRGALLVQAIVYDGKELIAKSPVKKYYVDESLDCIEYTQTGGVVSPEVLEDRIAAAQSKIDGCEGRIGALEEAYSDTEELVGDFISKYEAPTIKTSLAGKKWLVIGDIQSADNSYKDAIYAQYAAEKLGITDIVRCVSNYGGIAKSSANDSNALCVKAKALTEEADLITVMGGLIDNVFETSLGSAEDTAETSVYGAMNSLCTTLLTKYPGKTIVFITPVAVVGDTTASADALKTADYARVIKSVCEKYSIPVYDAHSVSGICPLVEAHRTLYTVAGMYLNTQGHKLLAKGLVNFLRTLSTVETSFTGGTHEAQRLLLNKNSVSLYETESASVGAYVLPANADSKAVIWSADGDGLSITENGSGCTVSGETGEYLLTCSTEDSKHSASCAVTVKRKAVLPQSVTVSAPSQYVAVGEKTVLTASVSPSNAALSSLEWSTDNESVILVPDGNICTVIGAAPGTATVCCRAPSADVSASVQLSSRVIIPVSSVSVEPVASAVAVGQTKEFNAFISPENAENGEVIWHITDPSVASVSTDGAKCVVTGVSPGSCTLWCASLNGKKSNEAEVIVADSPVSVGGISLDRTTLTVGKYKTASVASSVTPSTATNKRVLWHASNDSIEITEQTDTGCTVKGVKYGTAKLTAATVDGSYKAVCTVNVPEE